MLAPVGAALLFLPALMLVLDSCATGRGSTFSSGVQGEAAAARKSGEADRKKQPPEPVQPRQPVAPSTPHPGSVFWFAPPPPPAVVYVPVPLLATLVIQGLPSGALLLIDGLPRLYGVGGGLSLATSLSPGHHELEVRLFGMDDLRQSLDLQPGESYSFAPQLVPSAFALREVTAQPPVFDPEDPGSLGRTRLVLHALAPGEARLEILDAQGNSRIETKIVEVSRAETSLQWDGRDRLGRPLPPGAYDIVVRDRAGVEVGRGSVHVEGGRYTRSSTLYSGGGTLFAPTARAMEAGGVEIAGGFMAHTLDASGPSFGRLTLQAAYRIGVAAVPGMVRGTESPSFELGFSSMGIFHPGLYSNPSTDSFNLSGYALFPLFQGQVSNSFLVRYTWGSFIDTNAGTWPSPWDGPTRFPGLAIGLPIEIDQDNLRLFVSPEFEVSTFYPGYDPNLVPGFYAWGYLRAGFELTVDDLSLGLSGALRSTNIEEGLGLAYPIAAGFEARWHSPDSPFVLSFMASGEFDARSSWYLNSGVTAGFRL